MDIRPSTRGATVKGARELTALSLEVIDKQIALELSARKNCSRSHRERHRRVAAHS
jgi:hypothetical protein